MPGERQESRRETISGPEIVHPKTMPVILTTPTEVDRWLTEGTRGSAMQGASMRQANDPASCQRARYVATSLPARAETIKPSSREERTAAGPAACRAQALNDT